MDDRAPYRAVLRGQDVLPGDLASLCAPLPCRACHQCTPGGIVPRLKRWRAQVQAAGLLDNPDQRISSDIRRAAEVYVKRDAWGLRLLCDRLGNAGRMLYARVAIAAYVSEERQVGGCEAVAGPSPTQRWA